MTWKSIISSLALFVSLALLPNCARATNCANLPTQFLGNEFPAGDFFSNFNNPCYAIPLPPGNGANGDSGDLNAMYTQIFYKVNPQFQLIVIGTFPDARFFSFTAYDEHSAISQTILDANIAPLTSQYINPFQPGAVFVPGQQYAIPINFGGTPGAQQTGCMTTGYNLDQNALDATQRHQGMDWNWDAAVFQAVPPLPSHVLDTPQHTNPTKSGYLIIRNYLDIDPPGVPYPAVIVRDVASGCAYPANYVFNNLLELTIKPTGPGWLDTVQTDAHKNYEHGFYPKTCFKGDPQNLAWMRGAEYVPGGDPGASYIKANVPENLPVMLAAAGEVMRIRARLPSTPPTPCTAGCSRDGNEQLRYMSLSFQNFGGITLASLADTFFTKDPNGYVTLIVGTGAAIPSWITPANGYTYLDLTAIPNYQLLNSVEIRDILAAATFNCSAAVVPFNAAEYTPAGGLMGEYLPVVDYPLATSLPPIAVPLLSPGSCGIFPNGEAQPPSSCGISPTPPESIQYVNTQCAAPDCTQFLAQPLPPITITGAGFGNFPNGLPFTGDSNYLEVTDLTQNWDAGYGSDLCNVYISSWQYNNIQFVPGAGQNGLCPLLPGDQLMVKVWNPEMPSNAVAVAVATVGSGITVSNTALSFGNVTVGAAAVLAETLTNSGTSAVGITGISASGSYTQSNNCGASVAAGASCSITVTFSPAAAGVFSGQLSITTNPGGRMTINLRGTGVGVVLSLPTLTVVGGNPLSSALINQISPAPAAGETIALSSSNPALASPPASVTIAAGATSSAPFTITTTSVASTTTITLTATLNGIASSVFFNVYAASLSKITVPNPNLGSGSTEHGNSVSLDGLAPPGGAIISLSSSNPAVASVPASVTIAANSRSVNFDIVAAFVTAPTPIVLTAAYAGKTKTTNITVGPVGVASVNLSPMSVTGGLPPGNPNNTVTLNAPAPPEGAVVTLSSSNPALATPPATVTVPAGSMKSSSFTITTTPVGTSTGVMILATYNGVTASATLTVNPPMIYSVKLSQTTVTGGQSVPSNVVNLNAAAPAEGAIISLTSSNPAVASVPASATVMAGLKQSAPFTITTTKVTSPTTVTITASYAGSSQSATLTVEP